MSYMAFKKEMWAHIQKLAAWVPVSNSGKTWSRTWRSVLHWLTSPRVCGKLDVRTASFEQGERCSPQRLSPPSISREHHQAQPWR